MSERAAMNRWWVTQCVRCRWINFIDFKRNSKTPKCHRCGDSFGLQAGTWVK